MTRPTDDSASPREPLGRSARLHQSKFAGLIDRYVGRDRVLLADDATAEVFDGNRNKTHYDCVAVLTESKLWIFRPSGVMGPKKPFEMTLTNLDEVAVTRQHNLSIHFTGEHGWPGLWKLIMGGDQGQADLWMETVHAAGQRASVQRTDDANRPPVPDGQLGRLHDLIDDLRPIATPAHVGVPFGEGAGLEQAMQHMFVRLQIPDDARACGETLIVDILAQTKDDQISRDLRRVMGATPEAAREYRLDDQRAAVVRQLGEAACSLIAEFEGPGAMWDLWVSRDDVVGEMLCWHAVARLRMATIGRMTAVQRPA